MFKGILGISAVLGLTATTALVGCGGNTTDDAQGGNASAVISDKQFSVDCTITTIPKDGDTKQLTGYVEGQFQVHADGALGARAPITISIGARGKNDFSLTVKSGSLTDAKNEIFEFVGSQRVLGIPMDITVKYDGAKKLASVDSRATGKDTYNASCRFTDEAGNETTNFVEK